MEKTENQFPLGKFSLLFGEIAYWLYFSRPLASAFFK